MNNKKDILQIVAVFAGIALLAFAADWWDGVIDCKGGHHESSEIHDCGNRPDRDGIGLDEQRSY